MDGEALDQQALTERVERLREQHESLNHEADALAENGAVAQLKFARLKKEKLRIKDQISQLEDQITPDIIA